MPKFGSNVDFRKNELIQARLENIQTPAEIQPGRVWFDPIVGKLKFGNAAGDAAIDPTDRTQHHGTQVSATISDLPATIRGVRLDEFTAPTAPVSLGNQRLSDVADPTEDQDAINNRTLQAYGQQFVDFNAEITLAVQSLHPASLLQLPAYAVATTPVTLHAGLPTIDGVAVPASQLPLGLFAVPVLLTAQVDPTENGIWYVVNTGDDFGAGDGVWVREHVTGAPPTDGTVGAHVFVSRGVEYAGSWWTFNSDTQALGGDGSVRVGTWAESTRTLDLIPAPASNVSLNDNRIVQLSEGIAPADATNLSQVQTLVTNTEQSIRTDFEAADTAAAADLAALAARTLDLVPAPAANVAFATRRITNLGDGIANSDATTVGQVATLVTNTEQSIRTDFEAADTAAAADLAALAARTLDLVPAPAADVSLASHRLVSVADGIANSDATTVGQVSTLVATTEQDIRDDMATATTAANAALAALAARTLDLTPAPVANVDMAGNRLVNLANSVGAGDAVTRGELDAIRNGTDWKESVLVKSVGNRALTGLDPIDGVTLPEGARVLLTEQTDPSENGIWNAHAGAWTRAADAEDGTLTPGASVSIEQGTVGGTSWRIVETATLDVGVDAQTWVQFAAATAYTGSGGVVLTGTNFTLEANVPRKYVQAVGGVTQMVVSHNLGTRDITVSVYFDADGVEIECDIARTSANAITLGFSDPPPPADSLRCVVIG